MPSPTSRPDSGSSSRLQRLAARIRRSHRTVTRVRSPTDSCSRTIRSRLVGVVGELDGVDLDAVAERASRPGRAPTTRDPDTHPQRRVEPLGLGHHRRASPGPCGNRARCTAWWPRSASGSGYCAPRARLTRTPPAEQAVAVAAVVEHGHPEPRLADVDVPVRAHLELGGVPRGRRVGGPAHVAELDVARGRVGVHVEREHHRQQVLAVLPVELDPDVEPWRAGPQRVRHDRGRRRRTGASPAPGPAAGRRRSPRPSRRPRRQRTPLAEARRPRLEVPRVVPDRVVGRQLEHRARCAGRQQLARPRRRRSPRSGGRRRPSARRGGGWSSSVRSPPPGRRRRSPTSGAMPLAGTCTRDRTGRSVSITSSRSTAAGLTTWSPRRHERVEQCAAPAPPAPRSTRRRAPARRRRAPRRSTSPG